jgi:hypothetical protein
MINFFRKIRKKLADDNQLLKYSRYAIGEILLVVIGILIALSINNWNQNRINSLSERLLLKEINAEFKLNKKELENTVRAYVRVRKHCNYILESFPIVQNKIDKDSLSSALGQIRNQVSADLSTGSISTLINTSSFEIISNEELRSLLIQWDDLISDYFEREGHAINYTRQTIIPYLAKRIPQPYIKGLDDDRVDLSFLSSIEFENLINDRHRGANSLLKLVEDEDYKIRKTLNRIIFLSNSIKE